MSRQQEIEAPEPITPFTVIRDTHAPNASGKVGDPTAQLILVHLARAGFSVTASPKKDKQP